MRKSALLLLIVSLSAFTSCTKNHETKIDGNKISDVKKQAATKISTAYNTSFAYSGSENILLNYDALNGYIRIDFNPPQGVNYETWYLTVQSINGDSYLVQDQVETSAASILHPMDEGDILLITIQDTQTTAKYVGVFYDVNTNGASYVAKSSPFPIGGFHWTVSTQDSDTLGLVHIDWKIPNSQDFPIFPKSTDKYYFYYSMYDPVTNTGVQYADSTSIFNGKMSLGKPFYGPAYSYVTVQVYIKGLRLLNGQQYATPGVTNGQFVASSNNIPSGSVQEYGTQQPGCSINNGSYSYQPVSIYWE